MTLVKEVFSSMSVLRVSCCHSCVSVAGIFIKQVSQIPKFLKIGMPKHFTGGIKGAGHEME